MWFSLSLFSLSVVTQHTVVNMSCTEAFQAPKVNVEYMVQILIYVPTQCRPTTFTAPGFVILPNVRRQYMDIPNFNQIGYEIWKIRVEIYLSP